MKEGGKHNGQCLPPTRFPAFPSASVQSLCGLLVPSPSSWPAPLLQPLDGSAEPVGGDGSGCYGAVGRDYEECGNPSQLPVGERRVLTRPFQVADLCPGEFLLAQHVLPCRSVEVEAEAQPSQRYPVDLDVGIVVVESLEPRYPRRQSPHHVAQKSMMT